jgi:hypothetical protein
MIRKTDIEKVSTFSGFFFRIVNQLCVLLGVTDGLIREGK